jgi:hypothetical protein
MKSKTTVIWFTLAVTLAAAIWILNNYFQPASSFAKPVFPGLRTERVVNLQITPAGAREISVTRTNQAWLLDKPIVYPAQAAAIEGLLSALEKLAPVMSFSAAEMSGHKDADAEFGFDNPQFRLDLATDEQSWHLLVGNKTAPGDGVYVRVVGATGSFVTGTGWLQFLPHDAGDWRDTTLVEVPGALDRLVITNGTQVIELSRNVTNRIWRMARPLQARANNLRIVTALNQLRAASVARFVSDDPKADLTAYGLEPAALDVWLGTGTNLVTAVHAGKDVTGFPGEVYARREGWNTVVTTAKDPLAPWRGSVNDFRDPNLLDLTAATPIVEIQAQGENNYTLQQQGSNVWTAVGEKFPVDADEVRELIRTLAGLQIAAFVQDAVTPAGLQNYGLAPPSRIITLRSVAGDTNSVIAQLRFGNITNNQIYVKRGDEDFVDAMALNSPNLGLLAQPAESFRTPQIWNFSQTNVAEVTLHQNGKTRQMIRTGTNDWSLAPGSQGIINSTPAVEETIHRLGNLRSWGWQGRNFTDAQLGRTTNGLSITVELISGEKYSVDFGATYPLPQLNTQSCLAAVTLDGERWAFVFPADLYVLVQEYLTIPPGTP